MTKVLSVFLGGIYDGKRLVGKSRHTHVVNSLSWGGFARGEKENTSKLLVETSTYDKFPLEPAPTDWTLYVLRGMKPQDVVDQLVRYYRSND